MRRREYLRGVLAAGAVGGAGCLGRSGGNSHLALPEPDREFESADVPYPAWGERVPDVTIAAPLEDRAVALADLDRPALLTYFYSHCQTVCPVLVSALRNVQTHALNNGYGADVAFFPVTFDPERDDAQRLEAYAEKMNVDTDAGNWTFLRPSPDRVEDVVTDEFGVAFERSEGDGDGYMFSHTAIVTLVNADGYVERAYRSQNPDTERLLADLETVRNA